MAQWVVQNYNEPQQTRNKDTRRTGWEPWVFLLALTQATSVLMDSVIHIKARTWRSSAWWNGSPPFPIGSTPKRNLIGAWWNWYTQPRPSIGEILTSARVNIIACSNHAAPTILPCGGIGRHSGLKIRRLRSYEFESRHGNHIWIVSLVGRAEDF